VPYLQAGTISSQLPRGNTCGTPGSTNPGIALGTGPSTQISPAHGDWVKWGSTSTLTGAPFLQVTHITDTSWGTPLAWTQFGLANEAVADAVWGGGGGLLFPTYQVGDPNIVSHWYTTSFQLRTQ
jgi:hypothetical protein